MESTPSVSNRNEEGSDFEDPSPRTSISSNVSNLNLQSPTAPNHGSQIPGRRHSVAEVQELHYLSHRALSRRLSTLSVDSGYSESGENNLNWNPREAGLNGMSKSAATLVDGHSNIQCPEWCTVTFCSSKSFQTYEPGNTYGYFDKPPSSYLFLFRTVHFVCRSGL